MVADGPTPLATPGRTQGRLGDRRGPGDQLDDLVRIVGPGLWIGCVGLAILVVGLVAWAFIGTVSQTAAGQGMIVSGDGLRRVHLPVGGLVTEVGVRPGDEVVAGQTLFFVAGQGSNRDAVTAPVAGLLIDMDLEDGDVGAAGMIVAVIAPAGPLSVVAYVPLAEGKQVAPGMAAEVSPLTVPRELGHLPGRVESVSPYPVPMAEIAQHLDNELLAEQVAAQGAAMEVKISLTPDASAPSGYRWSSGSGPPTRLTVGTPAAVQVMIASDHPVNLLTGSTGALLLATR